MIGKRNVQPQKLIRVIDREQHEEAKGCTWSYSPEDEITYCTFTDGHDRVETRHGTLFDHGNEKYKVWWNEISDYASSTEPALIGVKAADPPAVEPEPDTYDAIKVIEAWGLENSFRLGYAIKCIARSGRNGNRIQDLEKALWYLQREVDVAIADPDGVG